MSVTAHTPAERKGPFCPTCGAPLQMGEPRVVLMDREHWTGTCPNGHTYQREQDPFEGTYAWWWYPEMQPGAQLDEPGSLEEGAT